MNLVPTLLPCSSECVIQRIDFNAVLEARSSATMDFSTIDEVMGSKAEVGSVQAISISEPSHGRNEGGTIEQNDFCCVQTDCDSQREPLSFATAES